MPLGILFVIAACLCWGLIFPIPKLLTEFSPFEVSLGRYFFFGLTSLILLLAKKRHLFTRSLSSHWRRSLFFALLSTLVSYTLAVVCIRYANSAVAALIFGLAPITIPLSGNWVKKEYSFKSFTFPLLLVSLGIILTNFTAFNLRGMSLGSYLFGLVCGFASLGSWTWYTIANFHFVGKNRHLSSNDWVTMMGTSTLFLVLVFGVLYFLLFPDLTKYFSFDQKLQNYLIGSCILGTISTWVAFFFWNLANLRLPVSIAGQFTVFEMIFGLIFVYLVEKRWPSPFEISGIAIMISGVLIALKTLSQKKLIN